MSATPLPGLGYTQFFPQCLLSTYDCFHVRWDVREACNVPVSNYQDVLARMMGFKRGLNMKLKSLKLLLHPIVRVYAHNCAVNIVEIY